MKVREAALTVLREAAEPLKAEVIASRALSRGLWRTDGKTPGATVAACLYTDIQRRKHESPFVLVAAGTFMLRDGKEKAPPTPRPATPVVSETCSFTDAAERVLEDFGDQRPMHYRQITERALEKGWVATKGKTPEATLYAQVLMEIKRRQKRGEESRFVQHGRGYVGLSRWMGRGLAFDIERHNKRVRKSMQERLLAMDWGAFEELVARLLAEIGFEDVEVTRRSGDKGIDVRGTLVVGEVIRTRMAIQVKKWKPGNHVQSPVVQQVRGSLGTHEQGLIITTSDFSEGARTEAARPNAVPVGLMNGEQLVALLAEYRIGITRRSHDILELEEPGRVTSERRAERP